MPLGASGTDAKPSLMAVVRSASQAAWAHAQDLAKHEATALSLTPGWLRSEMMLDQFGVTEENWRDATTKEPHFAISETPRYSGRAAAPLASDAARPRCNSHAPPSAGLPSQDGVHAL